MYELVQKKDFGLEPVEQKASLKLYQWTKNLSAVQLLLGHSKIESTVRYLGVEVDDALSLTDQTEA